MKNRIDKLFETKKDKILSIFYTAGFPKLNDTVKIAIELESQGVDLIEIGIPFSDPVADGPTIQESNKVALSNGMNLKLLMAQLQEIRKKVSLPIILMGYLNPVLQYGIEQFLKDASLAGVDGIIIPDLPLEEYERQYKHFVDEYNMKNILLIAPTTSEQRVRKIDEVSSGFIYAVSSSSTTGKQENFTTDQLAYFEKVKAKKLKNHFLIGFGVHSKETFQVVNQYASGAIIGSAFIKKLNTATNLKESIRDFVRSIN